MSPGAGNAPAQVRTPGTLSAGGPRVLVTRPAEAADELVDALEVLGCSAVRLPLLARSVPVDPRPMNEALGPGAEFDWILVTSAAAVPSLVGAVAAWQRQLASLFPVRIAAVGHGTARALTAAGRPPDLVPARQDSAGLVAALGEVTGQRILLPRADIAGPELPAALRAAGAAVTEVVAYRTLRADVDPALLAEIEAQGVAVITFASGSAVWSFMALPEAEGLARQALVACLGPTTAEVARAAGLTVHAVARERTAPGLARAAAVLAGVITP